MDSSQMRLLVVEGDATDVAALERAFGGDAGGQFVVTHAASLAEAFGQLDAYPVDLVLLDLHLPDSTGVETFVALHRRAPHVPVLVLTTPADEALAAQAVEEGAQDYLVKANLPQALLVRSIRYAIERARLQQALAEAQQRRHQEREMDAIDRLSRSPGTSVTARMYSSAPLREQAPETFDALVSTYGTLLDLALDRRTFAADPGASEPVRDFAEQLGVQRAAPRDVVEIHTRALRARTADGPWQRAQAYLVEGRLLVLELMGHLASFYRSQYPARTGR